MISFVELDRKYKLKRNVIKKQIKHLILSECFEIGDINVVLCSDEVLLETNIKHLNHDYFTDIITFDFSVGKVVSGDLMISLDRVVENANVNDVSVDLELTRVFFHGVLHLCGYKDKNIKDKLQMTNKENQYLKECGEL